MFDFVHNNKKIVRIFMALIILPFAFWGLESYNRSGDAGVAANVNGEKVTLQEFESAFRQQQEMLREQLGSSFDAAALDTPEMKRAVLDGLIAQRLMLDRAKSVGMVVTDEQVAQIIGGIEAFYTDGRFDKKRYREILARENISPSGFEARVRNEILSRQMQDIYTQNGFVSASVVDNVIRLNEQRRVIKVALISRKPFEAKVEVADAAVKDYFEQNPGEFQIPEQAKVEYVRLSVDDLLKKISVDKDEIRNYYKEHEGDYVDPEVRKAAHILISINSVSSQSEQDQAKAKAEQILLQVKSNPARFAELAKKNSQDPGSAEKGGDLGFFGRGMMVKPFEEAVFSMRQGEISGLVKSDFGYHIIKLLEIQPPKVMPFEQAREGIAYQLRQQKALDRFAELAEQFSNVVYEQSDTLQPAAELVGARIEQSQNLTRQMATNELWTPEMLQAVFSDDVAKGKRNTTAIEVAPNTLVAARVLEYKPAALRDFADVRMVIREKLSHLKSIELAQEQGEAALVMLQSGKNPKLSWQGAQTITRAEHGSLEPDVVRSIFQADAGQLPQYIGAKTTQGDYIVARIEAIKAGEVVDDAKRSRYAQQMRRLTGEELSRAYLADAKQQADISISLSDLAKIQP